MGRHQLKFLLAKGSSRSSCIADFTVLRGSAISLKASGGRRVSGTLKGVNFGWAPGPTKQDGRGRASWSGLKGLPVKIQYRAASGRWVTAKTVKTTAGGRFQLTKSLGRHRWWAVYAGSAADGARTSKTVTG